MGSALSSLSQWFPHVCHSSFCLLQVFAVEFHDMFHHWRIPQLLFFESKLLKPTTEESQKSLTPALNCKEEQCDMFGMASFEGVLKPFFICLKTLSHSEVSHSIRWCIATQSPAVPWPPHSDIKPSLNLRISFQRKTYLVLFSKQGNGTPWWSKAGLSGAHSQH